MKIFATCVMVWIAAMFAQINGTNLTPDSNVPASLNGKTWKMEPNATWVNYENGTTTYYRIRKNPNGALVVLFSSDNVNWTPSVSGTWFDKNGSLVRPGKDGKLVYSQNSGKTWTALDGNIWQDANEDWFLLENDGTIWKMDK